MAPTKQTVYLPVNVEEGLDTLSNTNGNGEKLTYISEDIKSQNAYSHWLKKKEGYFFTPEQLNEYTRNIIKQALETAAEKADAFIDMNEDAYIEGNVWSEVDKESITNIFEETFKKFEV